MDEIRFSPCCRYPAGTAIVPPVAAFSLVNDADWFSIPDMKMYRISAPSLVVGVNPTFAQQYRLFIGETDTNVVATTAIRNYAVNGEYVSPFVRPFPAVNSQTSFSHNLGVYPTEAEVEAECNTTEFGYKPGERVKLASTNNATYAVPYTIRVTPTVASFATQGTGSLALIPAAGGGASAATPSNWGYRFYARRSW